MRLFPINNKLLKILRGKNKITFSYYYNSLALNYFLNSSFDFNGTPAIIGAY